MIKISLFLSIFAFAFSAVDKIEKENTCFFLATLSVEERTFEMDEYIQDKINLSKYRLKQKILEDAYYNCMEKIADWEVQSFERKNPKNFGKYSHLLMVPLLPYKEHTDLKHNPEFLSLRRRIATRMNNSLKKDL